MSFGVQVHPLSSMFWVVNQTSALGHTANVSEPRKRFREHAPSYPPVMIPVERPRGEPGIRSLRIVNRTSAPVTVGSG